MRTITIAISCGLLLSTTSPSRLDDSTETEPRATTITGTFQNLRSDKEAKNLQEWQQLILEMKQSGLNEMIIQWLQYDDHPSRYQQQLKTILEACTRNPIMISLGLSLKSTWWKSESLNPERLEEEREKNLRVAEQASVVVRNNPCFNGWYIPHEAEAIPLADIEKKALLKFYRDLTHGLKALTPGKDVSLSGYKQSPIPEQFNAIGWWQELVNHAGIDRLYFQDGYGVERLSPLASSERLISGLAIALQSSKTKLWIVIEAFDQIKQPPGSNLFKATATTPKRLCKQVDQARALGLPMVVFSFDDYMRGEPQSRNGQLGSAWRGSMGCQRSIN